MIIEEVSVENFRNLTGQVIQLDQEMSFLVGENNLGKSNFLDFLFILFNRSCIPYEDFYDASKPIIASLKLRQTKEEIGLFEICDPTDPLALTIKMTADSPDSEMVFECEESGEAIPAKYIRRINLFKYASTHSNASYLDFGKERGVGKVLSRGLSIYQERNKKTTEDFLNHGELKKLMEYLNETFGHLPILGDYGMHVSLDKTDSEALGSVITLADSNDLHFRRVGSGVQCVALVMLSIIENIIKKGERRLLDTIVVDETGKRYLSCIITLDEPEAHLHPYMQRRLVKALGNMSSGNDDGFGRLLKEFFDIDVFSAQIIVVTHSPSILRKSHTEIVRFFESNDGKVNVVNGISIELDSDAEKHFFDRFELVREAFFVKKVLLVEGASEANALPRFASTMGIDIDDYGILVLQVGGSKSLPIAQKLLTAFGIENISIRDKDEEHSEDCYESRTTNARDFEHEIVNRLIETNQQDLFLQLLQRHGTDLNSLIIQRNSLNKYAHKIGYGEFKENIRFVELVDNGRISGSYETKAVMYAWLSKNKSAVLGALIGELLPVDCIPECYQAIFRDMTKALNSR